MLLIVPELSHSIFNIQYSILFLFDGRFLTAACASVNRTQTEKFMQEDTFIYSIRSAYNRLQYRSGIHTKSVLSLAFPSSATFTQIFGFRSGIILGC